jgi:Holliday junction resolvase RusA-like endonuclease
MTRVKKIIKLPKNTSKGNIYVIHYTENSVLFSFNRFASVNRLYRNRQGYTKPYSVNSKVYLDILSYHPEIIDKKFLQCDKYAVSYYIIVGDKKRRDISNYIKLFEDIVFRLFVKEDDSKVKHITVTGVFKEKIKSKYVFVTWHCLESNENNEALKGIEEYLK